MKLNELIKRIKIPLDAFWYDGKTSDYCCGMDSPNGKFYCTRKKNHKGDHYSVHLNKTLNLTWKH